MQTTHQIPLYGAALPERTHKADSRGKLGSGFAAEILRVAALHPTSKFISSPTFHKVGRNRLTRSIDAVLVFVRSHIPALHWIWIRLLALGLFLYARLVAATATIVTAGRYEWPGIPPGSVLAFWHGNAPSLLVAFYARRPRIPVKLMVSRDPRGDCVAVFCRWLGFEIVRGDGEHGGLKALIHIAGGLESGAAGLIAPDGGGPPFLARIGAAALASAAHAPLIAVGADCWPSLFERNKWDRARNPLPWSRIAVACSEPLHFGHFEDGEAVEAARENLQAVLESTSVEARRALGGS